MKEFWIVCQWDDYYPSGGIDDIVLVTTNYQEAKDLYDAWSLLPKNGGYYEGVYVDSRMNNCKIYSSTVLPWGAKCK